MTVLRTAGVKDMFIARFTPDGTPVWSQSFGGANYDEAVGVILDGSDELLATGWFAGPAVFPVISPSPAAGLAPCCYAFGPDGCLRKRRDRR